MKCPKCGREINDDAVFCISCGQRLAFDLPQTPQKEKNRTWLVISLGLFAIVLIIGVACLLLLNPFDRSNSDPYAYLSNTPAEVFPQVTEDPQDPQEPQDPQQPQQPQSPPPAVALPKNARPLGTPAADTVGLPLPDIQPEKLQATMDLYWTFLRENKSAQKYALINFIADDLPELILQELQEDGSSCFKIYYISGEKLQQLNTDKISAANDVQILSSKGSLMIVYNKGYLNHVAVDQTLKTTVSFVKISAIPNYTDSTLLVPASDKSLLELYLLGNDKGFSGSGWIRSSGTDYYYQSGKPLTHYWIEEDGILYYLGDQACITEIASQSMISDTLNAYFANYQTAFNEKDASYLIYATEANKQQEAKRFNEKDNIYLKISDLVCETTLHEGNHKYGSVEADVHLEYVQSGEWENAETVNASKDYRITLVWVDGIWYVDHLGNR